MTALDVPRAPLTTSAFTAELVEIVRQVLGTPVSAEDDLFAVHNLQSLMALRVVLAAQSAGLPLSIADLYKQRTVRAVAAHLAEIPPTPVADQ